VKILTPKLQSIRNESYAFAITHIVGRYSLVG